MPKFIPEISTATLDNLKLVTNTVIQDVESIQSNIDLVFEQYQEFSSTCEDLEGDVENLISEIELQVEQLPNQLLDSVQEKVESSIENITGEIEDFVESIPEILLENIKDNLEQIVENWIEEKKQTVEDISDDLVQHVTDTQELLLGCINQCLEESKDSINNSLESGVVKVGDKVVNELTHKVMTELAETQILTLVNTTISSQIQQYTPAIRAAKELAEQINELI